MILTIPRSPIDSYKMKLFRLIPLVLLSISSMFTSLLHADDFHDWAKTPPMGWNSWDNFATTVTESQTKAQADFMASELKSHGWEYIVVDIQWYEPGAKNHAYREDAVLMMDEYGRLQPAPNRFPSSADGSGFKTLADYVHKLGLKLGIHLMRGIPRQAVEQNLPIKGTKLHAQDIANTNSICPWNPDMYGVDMSKAGAQAYYDSVYELIASWGVDYVKIDDISRPYHQHYKETEAIRKAIDRTGRPIVLSLSPGATALTAADHVSEHANLWRISDDFWDRWIPVREQFTKLANWNPHRKTGAWPDADMLPFGVLNLGTRSTRFTQDEQRTVMTLWSIARSPLMHGGDMTQTDPFTLSLLTNDEVLAVNQHSTANRPLFESNDLIAWVAEVPDSQDKYLAVFNARDRIRLNAEYANFVSETLHRDGVSSTDIDVDISGGTQIFITIESTLEGSGSDHSLLLNPTLHFADGSTRPLTDEPWTLADALWDSASIRKNEAGEAIGIAAQSPARVFYNLPHDGVRFTATGIIEKWGTSISGTARFLVTVARSDNEYTAPGVTIPVKLSEIGFNGPVSIRDLWGHQELGEFSDTFYPFIPFHGAGLYLLSNP